MRPVFGTLLVGAVAAMLATSAQARLAEDPEFQLRGGVASVTRQTELSPVAVAIRTFVEKIGGGSELSQRDADGVVAFYTARNFAPAWTADGLFSASAQALVERLHAADTDGLNPNAYRIPGIGLATGLPASAATTAEADVLLTLAIAEYTREAFAGRLDPRSISEDLDMSQHFPDTLEAITTVADSESPVAALESFNPPFPQYAALRSELARVRTEEQVQIVIVPEGPTLRVGDTDDRVAILRARLELAPPEEGATVFDQALADAVIQFQAANGLTSDGIVGPNTLNALNGPAVDQEGEIIANMERWRWLPRDLGDFYVMVNVPEYLLRIVEDGQQVYQTRVVTGQRTHQTPIFYDEIEQIVVNPYWYVPESIITEEYYPVLRSDPGYFNRNNYDVWVLWEGQTYQVDPTLTDWSQIGPGQISMRQRPGDGNALGHVKFLFPNSHAVYLHDTPSRSLFDRDSRAFSHGCVRVQNPMEFADALLEHEPGVNRSTLEALYGPEERSVNLSYHVPVYITYFTAVTDEAGQVQFKTDVYGHSAAVRAALGV